MDAQAGRTTWKDSIPRKSRLGKALPGLGGHSSAGRVVFTCYPVWTAGQEREAAIHVEQGNSPPRPWIAKVPVVRQLALLIHQLETTQTIDRILAGHTPKPHTPLGRVGRLLLAVAVYPILVPIACTLPLLATDGVRSLASKLLLEGYGQAALVAVVAPLLVIGMLAALFALASLLPSVKRSQQMHAAEHQAIGSFEAHGPAWEVHLQETPKEHLRCGTSNVALLLIGVAIADAILGLFFSADARLALTLLYFPIMDYLVVKALTHRVTQRLAFIPGYLLQKLTTRPAPSHEHQLAISAFRPMASYLLALETND